MEKYAIYSYKLKEKPIRNFDFPTDGVPRIETMALEKRFEMLFGEKRGSSVEIQRIKKNRDVNYCPCKVVAHESGIVLLRLVNDKDVDIWEEKELATAPISRIEKTKKPSFPFCHIFIDTRPDTHLIAIETGTAAWRNTTEVKRLLQDGFNRLLDIKDYGVEVTLMSKMLPSKFWDYVKKKRKDDKVQIKSMTFSFTNHKRRPDIDIATALSSNWKHFESFIGWMDSLGGDKGEIRLAPPKNAELMGRKLADIKHMIEICSNNNYSLSITFTDNHTYKCNEDVRAELPMDEQTRKDFDDGFHDLFGEYKIIKWFDDTKKETDKYNDVEEIRTKQGRKAKAQVS